jgi:DNA-directed RNA polymerase subunit RPC12/RpoP
MGTYDTVHAFCPKCGTKIAKQSKAGPCDLHDYDLYWAPRSVIVDVADEEWWCDGCESRLRLKVQVTVHLEPAGHD